MEAGIEDDAQGNHPPSRGRHLTKRALKNKALAVSFNEKDLKDYVGGFHKRKKKRRKEAQKQIEVVQRRKRIEARKKRKLERESVYGDVQPDPDSAPDEFDENLEDNEESKPIPSVSVEGMTTYDNGDVQITVTTCEISKEKEEESQSGKVPAAIPRLYGADRKKNVPVTKKKSFKRVARQRSQPKPQSKRDKRKSKINKK